MHSWIGAGPEDRKRILTELGCTSVDELFASLPPEICTDRLEMEDGCDESTVVAKLSAMASENLQMGSRPCFLGGGVYRHVQPSVIKSVLSRAEFFTSYTPYQPEISQGTLQAIFEFQTLLCELTGLGIANASLYDGATAVVEAILFSHRVLRGKRNRVVLTGTLHPMYRRVIDTYAGPLGLELVDLALSSDGDVDSEALNAAVNNETCCVVVQSPNAVGVIENLSATAEVAHAQGALAVHVVTEAVSLGLLKAGGHTGCDVVCGEAQSFGLPAGFGGPHLGFFACTEKHVRQMPGRLVGETVDEEGRRAFCLTLSTREQHIRRAKATSNICTNQGLMALAATVWLETIGGSGLRELAISCWRRSEEAKRRLTELGGAWRLAFPDRPTFNEFLVVGPGSGAELVERLAEEGVLAGLPTTDWGELIPDGVLIATTECNSAADIDRLFNALGRVS
ncbi:MAG: aminomethyl-transferring glycine dehydrogenase subunit GcvPA [bacterium]|nr:aminomethyl-transferring glycine dehydrogenase subunit GcvPA [bacterium]